MNNPICRICLEEDSVENFIYPCKCSGTSKYVHKICLNEWRTLSDNSLASTQCFECRYKYKMSNTNVLYYDDNCAELVKKTSTFCILSLLFIFIIFGMVNIFSSSIGKVSNSSGYFEEILNINYLFITILIYNVFLYQIITCHLLTMKRNRLLYINFYCRQKSLLSASLITLLCSIFLICNIFGMGDSTRIIGEFIGIVLIIISTQLILKIHFNSIKKINKELQIDILNYEEDSGENKQEIEIVL